MAASHTLHATCVAWDDRAVIITGKSGAGKSALGLQLMALGCKLVADDGVHLMLENGAVVVQAPDTIKGLIEARGIGILNAQVRGRARVVLVVDLDQSEPARLPEARFFEVLGHNLPLIYRVDAPHFAPAILQILKSGWSDR
ncbi:HPr kinase/phosphatase C-terminal domain-containing protein [Yoonia sp.]|uniref:HPr kinase/phosphorylase n=1 Tax=Yoonia sp. TaxID=2212373 RepID=UPI002E09899F|nr:HPr kinase/phosphatase C-terminal domain-containing protein [Yoonia sp.]